MAGQDPHIHVERRATHGHAALRHLLAAEFGLVPASPAAIETGCGRRVPYAMTSARPESVTCLACREHAYREHLRYAHTMESGDVLPYLDVNARGALERARWHRDLARRFRLA